MSDRIFAVAWLGVCLLVVLQMMMLNVPFAYEPVGPKAFPILLAVLMAVCCLLLILKPDRDIHWPNSKILGKGAFLILILLAYAWLFETLGFPLATALMVWATSLLFGARWWSSPITAALVALGGYFLFDGVLEVSLPAGVLGAWM